MTKAWYDIGMDTNTKTLTTSDKTRADYTTACVSAAARAFHAVAEDHDGVAVEWSDRFDYGAPSTERAIATVGVVEGDGIIFATSSGAEASYGDAHGGCGFYRFHSDAVAQAVIRRWAHLVGADILGEGPGAF